MVTVVLEMTGDHVEAAYADRKVRIIVAQYDSEGPFEMEVKVNPLAVRLMEKELNGKPA